MYYLYLIQSDFSGEICIGITDNPRQRLKEHNYQGKKFTTRKSGKWIFIYLELYRSKKDAEERERKLKNHGKGKYDLLNRLKNSLVKLV